jgi:hypothetical protein
VKLIAKLFVIVGVVAINSFIPMKSPIAHAANGVVGLTTLSQPCDRTNNLIRSNSRFSFKFSAAEQFTVTQVQFKMYDATQGSGTSAYVYADNADTQGSLIGTLNKTSYDSTSKLATFNGTVSLPSAGVYWLEMYFSGANIYPCFTNSGLSTGSRPGWSTSGRATQGGVTFSFATWWVMELSGNSVDPTTISAPAISENVLKGVNATITVTANAVGKIQFRANGKAIPGCTSLNTSGVAPNLTATCQWKPAVKGVTTLRARLIPSSGSTIWSDPTTVKVTQRATFR